MNAVCPRCGGAFSCGRDAPQGCWCARVEVDQRALRDLAERYRGCLCPACLAAEATTETSKLTRRDRG